MQKIVDLVLATDMKQHFTLLAQFNGCKRDASGLANKGPGCQPAHGSRSRPGSTGQVTLQQPGAMPMNRKSDDQGARLPLWQLDTSACDSKVSSSAQAENDDDVMCALLKPISDAERMASLQVRS
jgi:hypothetical protein